MNDSFKHPDYLRIQLFTKVLKQVVAQIYPALKIRELDFGYNFLKINTHCEQSVFKLRN